MSSGKAVIYKTDRNHFSKEFRKAKWQTLFFGYGFIELKRLNSILEKRVYRIYDDVIEFSNEHESARIEISEIEKVVTETAEHQREHGLADLIITMRETGKTYRLEGIKHADALEEVLSLAIRAENEQRKMREKSKGDYTEYKLGGLEHMNSLVGLWQQGMISDEDFEREKQKFKKE